MPGDFIVLLGGEQPVATGSASPTSGVAPLEVSFVGDESTDFDGTFVGGGWDFQGGGVYDVWSDTELTYVNSANYTYTSGGVYNAKLRVIDDEGAWDVFTVIVAVDPEPDPPARMPQQFSGRDSRVSGDLLLRLCGLPFEVCLLFDGDGGKRR